MNLKTSLLIALYLTAIVAANLLVAMFGPAVTIISAFLFIGLDLTARDSLHQAWRGRRLWLKMAALIAIGSLLSYLLNRNAGTIAFASLVAFAAGGVADAVAYHLLRRHDWWARVNGSNVVGAAADSLVFPTLAFGSFLPFVVLGQFVAKVAGGALWSLILRPLRRREEV